ncbi:MAG TPA: 4'-phosphopantetheinyl transferase superfamily protein [Edaphocola sp.]|nr:4'-phosphopantetheinyl transferase superfamily protein [Edaphocola sp.]
MPLIFEKQDQHYHLIIWKITEDEAFFSDVLGFNVDIKHEKRRIEHLAGRYLLKFLDKDFPIEKIVVSPKGKPEILNSGLFFSISHSYPFVAAIIGIDKAVGVDIQTYSEKIMRIKNKFLTAAEQAICENKIQKITIAWSAKEALFKYYGLGSLNFKRDMPIRDILWFENHAKISMELEVTRELLRLTGFCEKEFAVAWL